MRTSRGDYPGASLFAKFDKDTADMTEDEMRALLDHILFQAMPGEEHATEFALKLSIAEQQTREAGYKI